MTVLPELSAEELARLFFHYREALAPDFECTPEEVSQARSWEIAPANERRLLVAAARLVLLDLTNIIKHSRDSLRQGDVISARSWRGGTEGKECGC